MHETAANADFDLIFLINFNIDTLLTKLIDAFGHSQEENLHLFTVGVLVDKVTKCYVYRIGLFRNIDGSLVI